MTAQAPQHGSNHEKILAITKFLSRKFTFMWFLAISQKFWTTEIWSYMVYSSHKYNALKNLVWMSNFYKINDWGDSDGWWQKQLKDTCYQKIIRHVRACGCQISTACCTLVPPRVVCGRDSVDTHGCAWAESIPYFRIIRCISLITAYWLLSTYCFVHLIVRC